MQEKKILPRRKGVVLLSVLGCLFVFLQNRKRPGICGKHPVDGKLHRKYFAVDGSAGVPSGISWNLDGASTLEPGTDRRRHREKAGCMVCPPFRLAAAPLWCADIFGSLLFLLLAWLPVYLAYYPGICAYDAPVQTGQIMEHYYFDHHPIVHTLFLQGMLWLGSHIFGSVNAGMAFYTAVQMLLLSGSMAYGMLVLHHRKTAAGWQLAIQLLGMFFPFHWYMSVSMTKDTVFSAFCCCSWSVSQICCGKTAMPGGLGSGICCLPWEPWG